MGHFLLCLGCPCGIKGLFFFRKTPPKEGRLRKGRRGGGRSEAAECGGRWVVPAEPPSPPGFSALHCLFKAERAPRLPPGRVMHIYQLQITNVQPREEQCSLSFRPSPCSNDSKTSNASRIWRLLTCHFLCAPIKSL